MAAKEPRTSPRGSRKTGSDDKYELVRRLKNGAYGKMCLVRCKADTRLYAMKEMDLTNFNEHQLTDAMREVTVLASLSHPNIIRHKESFVEDSKLTIVMEYATGGDLGAAIRRHKKDGTEFEEDLLTDWLVQLLLGLNHMHSRKVIHRDIKPENVFLISDVVKIGDFGLTCVLNKKRQSALAPVGTPFFMSPEICQGQPYDERSDVWALGITLYKLCTLTLPFHGTDVQSLFESIINDEPPLVSDHDDLQSLWLAMLAKDPDARPSARELLRRPLLRERVKKFLPAEMTEDELGASWSTDSYSDDGSKPHREASFSGEERALGDLADRLNQIKKTKKKKKKARRSESSDRGPLDSSVDLPAPRARVRSRTNSGAKMSTSPGRKGLGHIAPDPTVVDFLARKTDSIDIAPENTLQDLDAFREAYMSPSKNKTYRQTPAHRSPQASPRSRTPRTDSPRSGRTETPSSGRRQRRTRRSSSSSSAEEPNASMGSMVNSRASSLAVGDDAVSTSTSSDTSDADRSRTRHPVVRQRGPRGPRMPPASPLDVDGSVTESS